jgi:hypothetical protein
MAAPLGTIDTGSPHSVFAKRHTVGFLHSRNIYKAALLYIARFDFLG